MPTEYERRHRPLITCSVCTDRNFHLTTCSQTFGIGVDGVTSAADTSKPQASHDDKSSITYALNGKIAIDSAPIGKTTIDSALNGKTAIDSAPIGKATVDSGLNRETEIDKIPNAKGAIDSIIRCNTEIKSAPNDKTEMNGPLHQEKSIGIPPDLCLLCCVMHPGMADAPLAYAGKDRCCVCMLIGASAESMNDECAINTAKPGSITNSAPHSKTDIVASSTSLTVNVPAFNLGFAVNRKSEEGTRQESKRYAMTVCNRCACHIGNGLVWQGKHAVGVTLEIESRDGRWLWEWLVAAWQRRLISHATWRRIRRCVRRRLRLARTLRVDLPAGSPRCTCTDPPPQRRARHVQMHSQVDALGGSGRANSLSMAEDTPRVKVRPTFARTIALGRRKRSAIAARAERPECRRCMPWE